MPWRGNKATEKHYQRGDLPVGTGLMRSAALLAGWLRPERPARRWQAAIRLYPPAAVNRPNIPDKGMPGVRAAKAIGLRNLENIKCRSPRRTPGRHRV